MDVEDDGPISEIFDKQLRAHLLKLQLVRSVSTDFIAKFGGITAAIEAWSFDACDFMTSLNQTDPLADRIASNAQTFSSVVAMHRRLMKVVSWLHPSRQADLETAAAEPYDGRHLLEPGQAGATVARAPPMPEIGIVQR